MLETEQMPRRPMEGDPSIRVSFTSVFKATFIGSNPIQASGSSIVRPSSTRKPIPFLKQEDTAICDIRSTETPTPGEQNDLAMQRNDKVNRIMQIYRHRITPVFVHHFGKFLGSAISSDMG